MPKNPPQGYERLAERDKAVDLTGNSVLAQARRHKLLSAAVIGGAVAATAGAVYAATLLRKRNDGKPLNSVVETALTAHDVEPKEITAADVQVPPPPSQIEP